MARSSGIPNVPTLDWGSHLCQFYDGTKSLLEVIVPFLRAGLEDNEYCMWVLPSAVSIEHARQALEATIPGLKRYEASGQLDIVLHTDWYLDNNEFVHEKVLEGWKTKIDIALSKGFEGLRVTGDAEWVRSDVEWFNCQQYEKAVHAVIGSYRMLALCTYPIENFTVRDINTVLGSHHAAIQGGAKTG